MPLYLSFLFQSLSSIRLSKVIVYLILALVLINEEVFFHKFNFFKWKIFGKVRTPYNLALTQFGFLFCLKALGPSTASG